jgi:RimJ/RimL family protein N-acetyltransferase
MKERKDYSPFLHSERIYLREVRTEDADEAYHRWMNDPEVTRYLESRFFPTPIESLQNFINNQAADQNNVFMAICLRKDKRHIGNIKLGPINWIHRFAEIGILIGEKDFWGQGYGTEAIGLLVSYAFDSLNLHKLTAGCYEPQKASLKAFQNNGFQIEGVRKNHCYCDGTFVDAVLLGLINDKWNSHER